MLNIYVDSNILNTPSYNNSANITSTQTSTMYSILNRSQAGRLPEKDTGYALASKAHHSACFTGKPHLEGWVSRHTLDHLVIQTDNIVYIASLFRRVLRVSTIAPSGPYAEVNDIPFSQGNELKANTTFQVPKPLRVHPECLRA